jgi:hypothetical protein
MVSLKIAYYVKCLYCVVVHKIAAHVYIEYVAWITSVLSKRSGLFIHYFFSRCCIKGITPRSKLTANAEVLRTPGYFKAGLLSETSCTEPDWLPEILP